MFLVWLSLAVFAAITFLASVVARSALVAGGIGIAALLVAGILSALPVVGPYLPTGLWGAADAAGRGRHPGSAAGSDRRERGHHRGRGGPRLVGLPPPGAVGTRAFGLTQGLPLEGMSRGATAS